MVLISRFLLDLREASQRRVMVDTGDTLQLSTHLGGGSSISSTIVSSFGSTILPSDDARAIARDVRGTIRLETLGSMAGRRMARSSTSGTMYTRSETSTLGV